MNIYKPGIEVRLAPGVIAKVLSVQINLLGVRYEVVWWDAKTRKTEWITDEEILEVVHNPKEPTIQIGFITS